MQMYLTLRLLSEWGVGVRGRAEAGLSLRPKSVELQEGGRGGLPGTLPFGGVGGRFSLTYGQVLLVICFGVGRDGMVGCVLCCVGLGCDSNMITLLARPGGQAILPWS